MENQHSVFRKQLAQLLQKSNAHAGFDHAIRQLKPENRGIQFQNLPYSIWQIVEHIRIAQQDILDFSENKNYKELNWPADYWPVATAPENDGQWKETISQIKQSLGGFTSLIENNDLNLFEPFLHGDGQDLFREAILVIDHLSYHVGQIMLIRRLLGDWEE